MTCLYCYKDAEGDFHSGCSKKMFGISEPPRIPYTEEDILNLAEQMIKGKATITGVQPKLSLHIEKQDDKPKKLTITNLWGQFILKPPSPVWDELPSIEDLTMHLAELSNIRTAEYSLVRLGLGELAYITKRMDRKDRSKKHMEDMCQLLGRLTEDKYKSSHEQIAVKIKQSSINPGLDLVRFYELTLFCFLTGNADMHLKNFSLIKNDHVHYELAPAYDLVASALVVEGDEEELALTLCGKKKRLKKSDFFTAMTSSGMPRKTAENILNKYAGLQNKWLDFVNQSFLSKEMKEQYCRLIASKHHQLFS